MTTQWYAVCTKPQQELKVAAALSKKGIESFCPLTRKMLVNNGFRKKITWSPVLPCFVFVQISEAEFKAVLNTNDVINFMYWMGKPAVVAEKDIKELEQFTGRYPNVTVKRTAVIKNIIAENKPSPLSFTTDEDDESITKILPSLGFILTASKEKNYRIINRNIQSGKMMN